MSRPTNDAQDGAGLWPSSPINSHRHWRHYASQQSKIKLLSNLSYMDEKYRIRKLRRRSLHSSHYRPRKPFSKPKNTKIRPAIQLKSCQQLTPPIKFNNVTHFGIASSQRSTLPKNNNDHQEITMTIIKTIKKFNDSATYSTAIKRCIAALSLQK
mmetsp:Transcript_23085/g.40493  ORF Transcript_23085/g.40493 Transcript_23085/m.40493 type:complete len:155 (-) Transcript_23085:938-1402(-)